MKLRISCILITLFVLGFLVRPVPSFAATLSLSPSSGTVTVSKTVTVTIRVSSPTQAMNSAEGTLMFPTDTFSLQSISKSGSVFQFWTTEPAGSNASGRVVFSGGLPSPGFSGNAGTILKATFQAKAKGTATLSLSGAKVLANDGLGTDILTSSGGATYTIQAAEATPAPVPTPTPQVPDRPTPTITSSTHPDQNAWYTASSALVSWSDTANRRGVSFSVTQNANDVPDDHDAAANGTAEVALPSDGIWYFHLKARYDSGWSATAHFALRRDATPPDSFSVTVVQDRGKTDPSPVLEFAPTDATSGIDRTKLVLDNGKEQNVTSPATLHDVPPGKHHAVITAYDKAENTTAASADFTTEGYPAPVITTLHSPIILLQPIRIEGTAYIGDTVVVYINGEEIGRVAVGHVGSDVAWETPPRAPWTLTSDRLYRPGRYSVTAKSISSTGQESVLTDPVTLSIVGSSILLGGRAFATIALAPAGIFVLALIAALILALFVKLLVLLLHQRNQEGKAQISVERLRQRVGKDRIATQELDAMLRKIENDLGKEDRRRLRK